VRLLVPRVELVGYGGLAFGAAGWVEVVMAARRVLRRSARGRCVVAGPVSSRPDEVIVLTQVGCSALAIALPGTGAGWWTGEGSDG
jgi:hypothetical protein